MSLHKEEIEEKVCKKKKREINHHLRREGTFHLLCIHVAVAEVQSFIWPSFNIHERGKYNVSFLWKQYRYTLTPDPADPADPADLSGLVMKWLDFVSMNDGH